MKRRIAGIVILVVALVVAVGSIAFPGPRTNPPVENEVSWSSPEAREMFYQSCADCHSHETRWPWYAKVAPVSWFIVQHVNEGREHFNISVPDMGDADEAAEEVEEGEMPIRGYALLHPDARWSEEAKQRFIAELEATFGGGDAHPEEHEDHDGGGGVS